MTSIHHSQTRGIAIGNQSSFHWIGEDPEASPHSPRKISPRTEALLSYHALASMPQEFNLLFHVENGCGIKIRLLTTLTHFKDLYVSKVGKTPSPRLVREHSFELDDYQGCSVSFTYNARKYAIQSGVDGGGDVILTIKDVKLVFYDMDRVKNLIAMGSEKMVLRVRQKDYVGRPNVILTQGLGRSYTWFYDPKKEVSQSTMQIEEEQRDVAELRLLSGTPRTPEVTHPVVLHVPDNDDFTNPVHMSKFLVLESEEPLVIEFFNFRYHPPRKRAVRLPYHDMLAVYFKDAATIPNKHTTIRRMMRRFGLSPVFSRRRAVDSVKKLEFVMSSGVTLILSCIVTDRLDVEVSGVALHLVDYEAYFSE